MTVERIHLRAARRGDEDAVARVHVRAWQQAYRGLLPDDYLDQIDPAERASSYTFDEAGTCLAYTTVVVVGDEICGFATTGRCRDADKLEAGELYAIYVHPER